VDHPEFVGKIWGGDAVSDDVYLSIPELYINAVYPNPFVSEIAITISTKKSTPLTTSIYNMKGQLLYRNTQIITSGDSKILWNGLDLQGKKSPAGIYIINVQSGNNQAVKKVLHL